VKKIFNKVKFLPEFNKDLKKLKFRTLKHDLDIFTIDNKGIVQIPNLGIKYPKIYKARKFACRSLKGKGSASGIRIIYAYFETEDRIEFIEIYYKGNKENEDRERILRHYSKEG
jgi:mRNA-degrading endonuclease RelE of RelBE toxin-antitoxin system